MGVQKEGRGFTRLSFYLSCEKALFEQGHFAVQDLVASAEAVEIRVGAEVRRIDGDRVGAGHAPPFGQRRHLLADLPPALSRILSTTSLSPLEENSPEPIIELAST